MEYLIPLIVPAHRRREFHPEVDLGGIRNSTVSPGYLRSRNRLTVEGTGDTAISNVSLPVRLQEIGSRDRNGERTQGPQTSACR